jgi:hypothetical protein
MEPLLQRALEHNEEFVAELAMRPDEVAAWTGDKAAILSVRARLASTPAPDGTLPPVETLDTTTARDDGNQPDRVRRRTKVAER